MSRPGLRSRHLLTGSCALRQQTSVQRRSPRRRQEKGADVAPGGGIVKPGQQTTQGLKNVTLNDNHVTDWTMEVVPLTRNQDVTELLRIVRKEGDGKLPGFFAGSFTLSDKQEPLDTFLDPTGWGRGVAYVNGINLGRYWPMAGPQVRLYLPAPFLVKHPQENRLMLFEVDRVPNDRSVKLVDQHLLDAQGNLPTP